MRYEQDSTSSIYELRNAQTAWPNSDALNILESQFMSYRHRVRQYLSSSSSSSSSSRTDSSLTLQAIHLVGGASSNPAIQQLVADVMGCPVLLPSTPGNACSVGAAYKAAWALSRYAAHQTPCESSSSSFSSSAAAASGKKQEPEVNGKEETFDQFVKRVRADSSRAQQQQTATTTTTEQTAALLVATPDPSWTGVYASLLDQWIQLEERAQAESS